ncbi:Protein AGENET DOMAIN (AGD)-CONTAINING P1 [Linum perenne]
MDWVNGKWVKEEPEESNNMVESDNPSYRIGMEVEAKSDEAGFRGAWFVGMIVGVLRNDRFLVQYDNLVTDDETDYLKEEVNASDLRPRPPQVPIPNLYPLLEVVDAWFNDAWWVGHVVRVSKNEASFKYRVIFWTKEELDFDHSQLRPHLEWVDGEWCSVPQVHFRLYLYTQDLSFEYFPIIDYLDLLPLCPQPFQRLRLSHFHSSIEAEFASRYMLLTCLLSGPGMEALKT